MRVRRWLLINVRACLSTIASLWKVREAMIERDEALSEERDASLTYQDELDTLTQQFESLKLGNMSQATFYPHVLVFNLRKYYDLSFFENQESNLIIAKFLTEEF